MGVLAVQPHPGTVDDMNISALPPNPTPARSISWEESPRQSDHSTSGSQHMHVISRPVMQPRDAEGEKDDLLGLKEIASFLRDTAPITNENRHSWHSVKQIPTAEVKLVKRVFKAGGRKAIRNPPPETNKSRSPRTMGNSNTSQRVSKSGHKYIHITPLGVSSLGSEPCELEANQERPWTAGVDLVQPSRPSTALPAILAPQIGPTDLASPPRTAPGSTYASGNSDIERYVTALQHEMRQRWQSPAKARTKASLESEQNSPGNSPSKKRLSPKDKDISWILQASNTSRSSDTPPTPQTIRSLAEETLATHSPSRALHSHPAKPPSPPPRQPLPGVPPRRRHRDGYTTPVLLAANDASSAYCTGTDESKVHPLFRNSPDKASPSRNAFTSRHEQADPRSSSSTPCQRTPSNVSFTEDDTILVIRPTDYRKQRSQSSPSEYSQTALDETCNMSSTLSTVATDDTVTESGEAARSPQAREDRIKARKLRHLQTAKQNKQIRPQPLPTPEASPSVTSDFDDRPNTSISSAPTMTSPTTAGQTMSPIVSIIGGTPTSSQSTPTPLHGRRVSQRPAPLALPPKSSKRLSKLPEPSPAFPYDEPAFLSPGNTTSLASSAVQELLPPIALPPLSRAERRGLESTTATGAMAESFPLPHQRLSFASTASQYTTHQPEALKITKSRERSEQTPSSGQHRHDPSATTLSSARQGSSSSAHVASPESLDARVALLERQNSLLEAALFAVLRTGGLLNGCPNCDNHRASTASTTSTSQSKPKSYSLFPKTGSCRDQHRSGVASRTSEATLESHYSERSSEEKHSLSLRRDKDSKGKERRSGSSALDMFMATRRDVSSISDHVRRAGGSTQGGSSSGGSPREGKMRSAALVE